MLASLKRLWAKPPQVEKRIVNVPSTELRLQDWQQMPDLVVAAIKLKSDPTFSLMLQVLRNEAPQNYVAPIHGDTEACLEFGRVQGYQRALNILDAFHRQLVPRANVEASFLEPQEEIPPIPFVLPQKIKKEKSNG